MSDEKGTVVLRIVRRDTPTSSAYWEEFAVPREPGMNVISCLQAIERDPRTSDGSPTTPVGYAANCLEEVCGSCSMLINGYPQQACSTLIGSVSEPIELKPLTKFPVVRDLIVDREDMFEALRCISGWIPIDGFHVLGPGPRVDENERVFAYQLSRCMTCGCCMEGCPQYHDRSPFLGPAILAQVRRFNGHPTGAMIKHKRLGALIAPGGIADCGNAQNCVRLCPKQVPITDAIGELGWQTTKELFRRLLGH